ncbi:hypothetical protein [Halodesulfovibrio spirochaetisodalis]|uniref:Uncharacterized protein n=1 Tax=Halodesulfovibrio spirochaetisodalis TaxID=1560234 RepID=A0A1B7XBJ2_9BACT|nr:hypothetical protein [Halodesulfovibrio spirochaetisodalis]OBQ46697.1 hypothetical protein SP90_11275 [Halodesulfovibrio spirochaetisodalis]
MYWIFAGIAVLVLAVNCWWRKSIARNYKELIAEFEQKREGRVIDVTVAARKRKKYPNTRNRTVAPRILWETEEGFPVDVSSTRKHGQTEKLKMTLQSVVQDAEGNVYVQGLDRDSKARRDIDITTLSANVTLPVYKIIPLDEMLLQVCGLRLRYL